MVTLKEMIERFEYKTVRQTEKVTFWEMLTPAFIGGLVNGIIVGIPVINLLVPLMATGGYIATKLVVDYYDKRPNEKDAMKTGAFSGLIGAFIGTLITIIIATFFGGTIITMLRSLIGPTADLILTLSGIDPYISLVNLQIRFLANVIIGTFFGSIGGWLYLQQTQGNES